MTAETSIKVTVAVASTRRHLVPACVRSLLSQDFPSQEYEILVVADYRIPCVQFERVHWVLGAPKSIAAKRNLCLEKAQAPVVAFLDDDCTADPQWLRFGLAYLEAHPDLVGVQGRIVVPEATDPNAQEAMRLRSPLYQTSNIFYRIQSVRAVGGFDERFAFQREDVDLGFTFMERGFNIGHEPKAIVHHPVRRGEWWDIIHSAYRKRYDPLLAMKHPELFNKHFEKMLPGSFAAMIYCWLLLPVAFLLHLSWIAPLFPIAGSLALTFRRIRRKPAGCRWFLALMLNYLIAPLVALAVILIGKIKYRFKGSCAD